MVGKSVPEALLEMRHEIDELDDALVDLLSRRFDITRRVGQLKAEQQLDSFDPERERQKLERLASRAREKSLNPDFIQRLFQSLFEEVVENHKKLKSE